MSDGNIAPMAAQAESRPSVIVRPIHPDDIRGGIAALDRRIRLGSPLDLHATVKEILMESGMVSSRTEEKPPGKKKEKADVSPQSAP